MSEAVLRFRTGIAPHFIKIQIGLEIRRVLGTLNMENGPDGGCQTSQEP